MSKKIFYVLSVISFGVMCNIAQAQTAYPGLNFPQPSVSNSNNISAASMQDLMSARIGTSSNEKAKDEVPEMRRQALSDIASALGASGGLSFRMKEIKTDIDKNASRLDRLFDFSMVLYSNGVLAPVITEGLSNYSQLSDDEVRIADKTYKIESPARFVSVYPNWRTYLRFDFPSYETPSSAYLPKNDGEKLVWDEAIQKGWEQGISQANSIFEASYNRLERDYMGMLKFHILAEQKLVTQPLIAKANLGITGGGNEMSINDQVFRITDHSALNPHKGEWRVKYPVSNNQGKEVK